MVKLKLRTGTESEYSIFSALSHMSLMRQSIGALGRNSIGIVVLADGENLKFAKHDQTDFDLHQTESETNAVPRTFAKWNLRHRVAIFLVLFLESFGIEFIWLWVDFGIVMNSINRDKHCVWCREFCSLSMRCESGCRPAGTSSRCLLISK